MTFDADSHLVCNVRPAHNVEMRRGNARPRMLVLHYTGMSTAAKAVDWLAREESKVSCHYVIDEIGRITQMVPESLRAWHAGNSFWRGETDINSHSIGIEIQNPGHAHGYPDFPAPQMRAVVALSKDIVSRHGIPAEDVLAHSDVAPQRKIDPGEKFNWAMLAREGVGRWIRPSPLRPQDAPLELCARGERVLNAQRGLAAYGYAVPQSGELDEQTSKVVRAFQLHFRPRRADGMLDRSTELTLERLISVSRRPEVA